MKRNLPIFILSFMLAVCIIICCVLSYTNYKRQQQIEGIYLTHCRDAQSFLYSFLNGKDECYDYMTSEIYGMIALTPLCEDNSNIRHLYGRLKECHAVLVMEPDISIQYLDLLNEALLLYIDDNAGGCELRLQSFYNRVIHHLSEIE